jgi:hypothetical protein
MLLSLKGGIQMGLFNIFKKKDDSPSLGISDLKDGYTFEYDMQTWKVVSRATVFDDFGGGNLVWEITSGIESRLLSYNLDDEGISSVSKFFKIEEIKGDIRHHLTENEDPPEEIVYNDTTFYLESYNQCDYQLDGKDEKKSFRYWEFVDEEEEYLLNLKQWGKTSFEATIGKYIEDFQIAKIIPNDLPDANKYHSRKLVRNSARKKDQKAPLKSNEQRIQLENAKNELETVMVKGPWMNAIWKNTPVYLPKNPDLESFFNDDHITPLLDDDGYKTSYSEKVDWAIHWVIALLYHPDEMVVLEVLNYWEKNWKRYVETEVKMPYRHLLFDSAANHLLSNNSNLVEAAARLFWRGYSKENWEIVDSIFKDPNYSDEQKAQNRLKQYQPKDPEKQTVKPKMDIVDAAYENKTDLIKQMVQSGVNIESVNDDGTTVLMVSAYKGNVDLVKFLLDSGASIETRDNRGSTPLMWASMGGDVDVVELLLDRGADPEAEDNGGCTAFIYARNPGHTEIMDILTKASSK